MASLNTLRTKFGIVLSIIIALALLAFILSLKTEMGFSGNDPRVGVIGGEKINYSEYYDEYEKIKSQSGAQEGDEQQSAMLANATWQSLIARYVLTPGFERLGLRVTEPERMAMAGGKQPSQTFFNAFADPRTGAYNVAAVSDFLAQAEANPQAAQAWAQLNEQARMEREMQKFFGLVRGGVYVNALEVARGVEAANDTYAGKWAGKKYSEVPDSLFNVSDSDLRAYYNSHNREFILERPLVKGIYLKVPDDAPNLAVIKRLYRSGRRDDIDRLEKEVLTSAIHYDYFRDKWVDWEQIESHIPYDFGASGDKFLSERTHFETSAGGFTYLLEINDLLPAGAIMPFENARQMITDRLNANRRREYDERLRRDLYDEALKSGKLESFVDNVKNV